MATNKGTAIAKVTISRQLQGAPGAPAETYAVVVTPGTWVINPDGTAATALARVQVLKTTGGDCTDITDNVYNVPSAFKMEVVADGTVVPGALYWPASNYLQLRTGDEDGVAYRSIVVSFYTKRSGETSWTLRASTTCSPVPSGMPGRVRAPLRITNWEAGTSGMKYYAGDKEGDPWSDLVYRRVIDESGKAELKWGQCIQNFTRTAADGVDFGTVLRTGKYCFLQADQFNIIATDILLAQYALVKNLGVEVIEMRDASGNPLFVVKNGVVTCNTGVFRNVEISGNLVARTLDLRISTVDHNGSQGVIPNGSICLGASRITLPELEPGVVRSIKVLNPLESRSGFSDLILTRETANVRISKSLSRIDAIAGQVTLPALGWNGNVYIELLGYRNQDDDLTYWLVSELKKINQSS